jgi:hypothetical protein
MGISVLVALSLWLFGSRRPRTISVVRLVSLLLLAFFVWPGLMMWAFTVFFSWLELRILQPVMI